MQLMSLLGESCVSCRSPLVTVVYPVPNSMRDLRIGSDMIPQRATVMLMVCGLA